MVMQTVRPMLVTLAVIVLAAAQGCESRRATMGSWQRTLSDYTAAEANGDLNFLRGDPSAPPEHQFSVIGAKSANKSTDVNGVLLGRRTLQGRNWFIFLLGGIVDGRVEDVRLAALEDLPGKPTWVVSREDGAALATYQQHKKGTWESLNPARPEPPPMFLGFPAESDVFDLDIAQNTVSVTEKNSGARWTLVIPEQTSPGPPSTRPR